MGLAWGSTLQSRLSSSPAGRSDSTVPKAVGRHSGSPSRRRGRVRGPPRSDRDVPVCGRKLSTLIHQEALPRGETSEEACPRAWSLVGYLWVGQFVLACLHEAPDLWRDVVDLLAQDFGVPDHT